jgi:hypothetical protein
MLSIPSGKRQYLVSSEGFSGGTESSGIMKIFVTDCGVRHTKYFGSEDTKGFLKV